MGHARSRVKGRQRSTRQPSTGGRAQAAEHKQHSSRTTPRRTNRAYETGGTRGWRVTWTAPGSVVWVAVGLAALAGVPAAATARAVPDRGYFVVLRLPQRGRAGAAAHQGRHR